MRIFPRAFKDITVFRASFSSFFLIIYLFIYTAGFTQEHSEKELNETESEIDINDIYEETEETDDEYIEIDIEELRKRILNEDPKEFFSLTLGDANVSLFLTGSWRIDLLGNFGFSVSPLGTSYAAPENSPFFKQEADLGLSLWINNKWFIEANFLDNTSQNTPSLNTYRAGYEGFPGEFLQYAGFGNTGLDFPSFSYMDLGGDSISSFGAYSRFGTDNLTFHALVRYDTASREERTFQGGRERITSDVQPQNMLRGMSFVLPDENIESSIIVYIEDERGDISDNEGRRWHLAAASEYAVSRMHGILELSVKPKGMIAVSYSANGSSRPWINSMGYYDRSKNGFLLTVQNWFDDSQERDKIKLENYPQCGGTSGPDARPGEKVIGGITALVIYEPGTFSPFERRSRYEAPSGHTASQSMESGEAFLITLSTGITIPGYELIRLDTPYSFSSPEYSQGSEDIFYSDNSGMNAVYELLNLGTLQDRDPASLWPLSREYSEIYLPSSGIFTGDIALRFTNYSGVNGFYIGADVIPGSVQVWRNGIQHTGFSYSSSTGEVSINGSVTENEIIRITYLSKNEGTVFGSLAAGFGLFYANNAKTFFVESAAGGRWNISDNSFTQENYSSMGSAGISAKASWKYDNLDAYVTAGFNFLQTDTTGLYRAAGMEGNEIVLALPPESSFISNLPASKIVPDLNINDRADLIYRNYNNSGFFGSGLLNIKEKQPVVSGFTDKPYAAKDDQLKSQVLAAEFALNKKNNWTGFQVPIVHESDFIKNAKEIYFPFRFDGFKGNTPSDFELIIQIGSLSGRNTSFTENLDLIWEKIIYPGNSGNLENGRLIYKDDIYLASFQLNDEDRIKLGDAKYFRVIAVNRGDLEITGRVIFAPPIFRGASFRAVTAVTVNDKDIIISGNNDKVSAVEITDDNNSLKNEFPKIINRLHSVSNTQRILKIEWDDLDQGTGAGIDSRITELPLSNYNELSFFFKIEKIDITIDYLNFIIASGPENISDYRLKAEIPINALTSNKWHKITIRYQGNDQGIFINGVLAGTNVSYMPYSGYRDNNIRRTSYIAIFIFPKQEEVLSKNTVFIDEIILEDANFMYRINAGAGINYTKGGTILSVADITVLADFNFSAALESETSILTYKNANAASAVTGRSGIGFSLFGVNIKGDFSFTAAPDIFFWSAGHDISKSIWLFFLRESFSASLSANNAQHKVNLSFQSIFSAGFEADVNYNLSMLRQRWKLNFDLRPDNIYIPAFTINTEAAWVKNDNLLETTRNYGELWIRTWPSLIPDFGDAAGSRRTQTQINITQRTQPVGVVLSAEGRTSFAKANNIIQTNVSFFLDIPVLFERTNLNFRIGRSFSRNENYSFNDTNALDDGKIFFNNVEDWFIFWKYFSVYSLFTPELRNEMQTITTGSSKADWINFTGFNDHFSARVILPSVYNLSAFLIPSAITFKIERVLEQKMDTGTDSLNITGNLAFSAINMFGAMGYLPLFNFYMADELSHSIETYINIAHNENVNWGIQSRFNAGFRGFTGSILEFINIFSYRSNGNWSENLSVVWEAPTKKNLLSIVYDWASSPLRKESVSESSWNYLASVFTDDYIQLRRETLELNFLGTNNSFKWSIAAGHEAVVRILGRLNLSSFIKLRLNETSQNGQNKTFTFDALLGLTLQIMF